MTETKKNKLSTAVKAYLAAGVVIAALVVVLYVFTALAAISLVPAFAAVVWIWFALFVLKYLIVVGARSIVAVAYNSVDAAKGDKKSVADKLNELAKRFE